MKTNFAALALVAAAMASPMPQADTPDGCVDTAPGTFQVTVVNVTSSAKRAIQRRQLAGELTLTLNGGILKDQAGRQGYIASNYQWQFDAPPQANALSTDGYSLCSNGSLALAGSAIFYQCYSGNFFNLYDRHWAPQCSPIYLVAINENDDAPPATQVSDGQPQATTAVPISQISDGQPQATTAIIIISQISDGQPQAPTSGVIISQISDGQPQAPTGAPVTQISDGQPQAPTGAPISQISDGQPQAPAPTTPPYPSAPSVTLPVGTGNFSATATAPVFTGAAQSPVYGLGAMAAGVMGVVALL